MLIAFIEILERFQILAAGVLAFGTIGVNAWLKHKDRKREMENAIAALNNALEVEINLNLNRLSHVEAYIGKATDARETVQLPLLTREFYDAVLHEIKILPPHDIERFMLCYAYMRRVNALLLLYSEQKPDAGFCVIQNNHFRSVQAILRSSYRDLEKFKEKFDA